MKLPIDADELSRKLSSPGELGVFDVREAGQFASGHAAHAVSLPYSRLELGMPGLAPRSDVSAILIDAGDGVAQVAARRLTSIGYRNVQFLDGGIKAWEAGGHGLLKGRQGGFEAFARQLEARCRPPSITAADLSKLLARKHPPLVIDIRPDEDRHIASIPGSQHCDASPLIARWCSLALPPSSRVVIHAATRAQGALVVQALCELGMRIRVAFLKDGIEAWSQQGFGLQRGPQPRLALAEPAQDALHRQQESVARLAQEQGVERLDGPTAQAWIDDPTRTTHVFDVRATATPPRSDALPPHIEALSLIQQTDQFVGVRHGRVIVLDDDGTLAPVVATWLCRRGLRAAIMAAGDTSALHCRARGNSLPLACAIDALDAQRLKEHVRSGPVPLIELRASHDYRRSHAAGSVWSTRPHIVATAGRIARPNATITLIADEPHLARLAALDLKEAGYRRIQMTRTGLQTWLEAGLAVHAFGNHPAPGTAIDAQLFA